MFTHTLTGLAKSWFQSIIPRRIASIDKLLSEFIQEFH